MIVEVKQNHIRKARGACKREFNSVACPIAQALKVLFPDSSVSVSTMHASIGGQRYELPRSARNLISQFDSEVRGVKPIRFTIKGLVKAEASR